jgi:hypothetical protein
MPPLVFYPCAKTYQSTYREAEMPLPFKKTGYTAQVAVPAEAPRVECVTSETGTVRLQGRRLRCSIIVFQS